MRFLHKKNMKTETLKPLKAKLNREQNDKCKGSVWFVIIMSLGLLWAVWLLTEV